MRRFHSYGPVDCEDHFCVQRHELINRCTQQLLGNPNKSGHYFTIWAPRQAGKTWMMRQVKKRIEAQYGSRFICIALSMQGLIMADDDPDEVFFRHTPFLFQKGSVPGAPEPADWNEWIRLFSKKNGVFDRPLLLFIDEFDSLPARIIDLLVALFRDIYLNREEFWLHGLALIGVRGVLGVGSDRGSPFNIQRALHVPNFTPKEVNDLFEQYQEESGQQIVSEVVEQVYVSTRGQPGLVGWFGELLTEKYNPGAGKSIDISAWELTWRKARTVEWNNTVLNLMKKARSAYLPYVTELFTRADLPFKLHTEWCNYLYLNGVIDHIAGVDEKGQETDFCRFSSPFVQECLYDALTDDLIGDRIPILALDPLDELEDVFQGVQLNVTALLGRYKDYLARLKTKGLNPWKDQPRRKDLHYTEAVGHFHLYHWLQNALGRICVISPEFPTGNGKVDLHLQCGEQSGLIEVKSFTGAMQLREARKQAADYAKKCGLETVAVALFAPLDDETVLAKLSTEEVIEKITVTVTAIGWV